jgi:hypothetical protein
MTIGNSGNESYQHLPAFPARRILVEKVLGGYDSFPELPIVILLTCSFF